MRKVRSSVVTYKASPKQRPSAAPVRLRAKIFANGRSQAIRLPAAVHFTCSEVFVRKEGDSLILEPIPDVARDAKGWRIGLWDELARWRAGLDLDDFQIEEDPIPEPIRPADAD